MQDHTLRTMEPFGERMKKAAAYAGVEISQTAIAKSLGTNKQTVNRWFSGSEPRLGMLFHIAETWRINAHWLATGEGTMLGIEKAEALNRQEAELITAYRSAQPEGKNSMRAVAKAVGRGALAVMLGLALPQPDVQAEQSLHNSFWQFPALIHNVRQVALFFGTLVRSSLRFAKLSF